MPDVSLRSAYAICRERGVSNTLPDLCKGLVAWQAVHGHVTTHIYSFIDVNDSVSLFLCRSGNHEDLLTSPHVKKRVLLWQNGTAQATPNYLKQSYAALLRRNGITDDEIVALGLSSTAEPVKRPWWKIW